MPVVLQIVSAIAYCHQLHVVHRDLKPENVVFFNKSETVKLTDFGFSNLFIPGHKLNTSCGSLAYSAPEILLGDSYDAPAVGMYLFVIQTCLSVFVTFVRVFRCLNICTSCCIVLILIHIQLININSVIYRLHCRGLAATLKYDIISKV